MEGGAGRSATNDVVLAGVVASSIWSVSLTGLSSGHHGCLSRYRQNMQSSSVCFGGSRPMSYRLCDAAISVSEWREGLKWQPWKVALWCGDIKKVRFTRTVGSLAKLEGYRVYVTIERRCYRKARNERPLEGYLSWRSIS